MSGQENGSIALVVVSPRVPAGLMTREAWRRIEEADAVLARFADETLAEAVVEADVPVQFVGQVASADLADKLVRTAGEGHVVWLGSADADPGLTDALAGELTRLEAPPPVEVVVGSWDAPGSRLLDAVAVMDTLRSPGGCPWDAKQTHASLAPYLVEEAYEVVEAIGERDSTHLKDELGDVLLQVLFHARVASERADGGFDIDGVAARLVEKLVRRHPHVFADGVATSADEVEVEWQRIKAQEKPERDADNPLAGIPAGLPPLERAAKVIGHLERSGHGPLVTEATTADSLGAAFLDLVVQARALGHDPGVALASTLADLERACAHERRGSDE